MTIDAIKVSYDCSVLGDAYVNPKSRTGIFRVVEQLLSALLKDPKVEMSLIALNGISSVWEEVTAQLYLESNAGLKADFKQRYHPFIRHAARSAAKLQKVSIQNTYRKSNFLYFASIGIQVPFKKLGSLSSPLPLESIGTQVYHSPFYALPSNTDKSQVQRVLTVHDMIPLLCPEYFRSRTIEKFRAAIESIDVDRDWVICDSESTRQDFCSIVPINSDRVFTAHLAAMSHCTPVKDAGFIKQTLHKYGLPNVPYCLSLSTLEPRKNLRFLITSFLSLIQSQSDLDLNLVLVGASGWKNLDVFQTAISDPKLRSRIYFTGFVPDEDLSALYSGCLAFVYPSIYEGFGLPPLEAMQCGAPVITSNVSSLPEVVGDAGIMIDPTDEDAFCQAILSLVGDSALQRELSQKGLARAKTFSWEKCAQQTIDVYQIAAENP
jgi:glycosyltransferase involved in cell wall biosynthesis